MIVSAISDIPNVKNISDDAIICGVNAQEHDQAPMLTRFQELNFTLRKDNSVSDVRSLLGMTNYVSRFICNYAELLLPCVTSPTKASNSSGKRSTKRRYTS